MANLKNIYPKNVPTHRLSLALVYCEAVDQGEDDLGGKILRHKFGALVIFETDSRMKFGKANFRNLVFAITCEISLRKLRNR